MKGFEIIAIVIGVFFAIGIAVGMLLVIALPMLRAMLRNRRNRRRYTDGSNWSKLPPGDDDRRQLQQVAQLLKSRPEWQLLVVGHTDNVGGLAPNMPLSRARAEAVVQALASRYGVAPSRLTYSPTSVPRYINSGRWGCTAIARTAHSTKTPSQARRPRR